MVEIQLTSGEIYSGASAGGLRQVQNLSSRRIEAYTWAREQRIRLATAHRRRARRAGRGQAPERVLRGKGTAW